MKTKTRILSLILCLAMVIGYFTFGVSAADETTARLVTDVSTLAAGDRIVITNKDGTYALSTTQKTNNRSAVAISGSNGSFTVGAGVQILTLVEGTAANSWAFSPEDGKYLYASSTSANQLKTTSTLDNKASFNITITDGTASIICVNTSQRGVMQYNYNNGSPLFACYSSASQTQLAIYKIVVTTEDPEPCTHANVTVKYDETNHWEYCNDCEKTVDGTTEAHSIDANGDCTVCDHHEDPSEPEEPTTGSNFVKVTEAPTDWSGTYLIVYENSKTEAYIFNSTLSTLDADNDYVTGNIVDNTITIDEDYAFTVSKSGDNYTIKSNSGYYIGQTSDANGLKSNTSTTYSNTLSLNTDGTVNIVSGGAYLRFNAASDEMRFRYYKSSTYTKQKAITLYKLESESTDTSDVTFTQEGHNVRLQDLIKIGYYFKATAAEGVTFDKVGARLWTAEDYAKENNSALAQDLTATEKNGVYTVETDGIYAQNLDTVYVAVPYVVINGEYVYGDMDDYSVLEYAKFIYEYTGTEQDYLDAKSVIVDLLNYANAARNYFVLTEGLTAPETALNSILSDADKALDWNDSLKQAYPTADETGAFDAEYDGRNINLLEAIHIGAYYKNTDVAGGYFWTESAYDATQTHDATTKTGNAVLTDYTTYKKASVTGIYAYNLYDTYYLRVYNSANELSDTTALSVASYLTWVIENANEGTAEKTQALTELAKAMLIYGSNAKDNPAINK